ncbi:MAG: hypothetical protein K9J16_02030 [Melioribacteraceae bacterium]|nr:hypothetical protein [Melioribacteraceae bacterium]MCF8353045.1 hypothetical protein [Melioribacteraceae bacterium]MCF8392936.1 hypothetical protein [Melioribacteraceae bacterium]MCF8417769.1 hypothetical protein [Melioribacteraceae bacterium]
MNPFTFLLDLHFGDLLLISTRLLYNDKLQQPQKERTKGLVYLLSFTEPDNSKYSYPSSTVCLTIFAKKDVDNNYEGSYIGSSIKR